jgi:hypothetical protein
MGFEARTRTAIVACLIGLCSGGLACGEFVESGGDVKRLTVGAEGGTLAAESFALVVPPHALAHTFTLTVQRAAIDAPAGAAFTVGPDGVTFDPTLPAEATLHYDAAVHTHPPDVFAAIADANGWHVLPRPAGDTGTAGVARGVTTQVGTFGVIDCPGGVCP